MRRLRTLIACVASLVAATSGAAQERDARVLRPGELRVSLNADVFRADDRIDDALPLADLPELTADVFLPLSDFRGDLNAFFQSVGAAPPPALTAGLPDADMIAGARSVPLGISLGVFPRVELGAVLPIQRQQRLFTRFDLVGSRIGLNPDVTGNEALLGSISEAGEVVGGAAFLPLANSPAGLALQQLVQQRTGETLLLPSEPLSGREFSTNFPVEPFTNRVTDWQPGDLELFGRFRLLDNLGNRYYPSGDGLRYRAAAEISVRLPTGVAPDTALIFGVGEATGATGFRLGGSADLFAGPSIWVTAGGSWQRIERESQSGLLVPGGMIGGDALAVTSGAESSFELYAISRYRLTRELSIGGVTALAGASGLDLTVEGESFELDATNVVRAGFVVRYTTFPAYEEGNTPAGVEISLGYTAAVAGSGDQPALGRAFFSLALFPRLWGERRITPAEPG